MNKKSLLNPTAGDAQCECESKEVCRPRIADVLSRTINAQSRENASNTPDFILGEFLGSCLEALETAIQERENWYGIRCQIGSITNTHSGHVNTIPRLDVDSWFNEYSELQRRDKTLAEPPFDPLTDNPPTCPAPDYSSLKADVRQLQEVFCKLNSVVTEIREVVDVLRKRK